ncbi:MAG: DUF4388 domain-containing protein [Phormidesmis sp.]
MLIQGQTSDFTLPELFKFLKDSRQTGRLSLRSLFGETLEGDPHYLWFEEGKLLAASQRLDGLGLLHLLRQRSLLQGLSLTRLLRQCPPKVALGQFLRDQAVLSAKQLQSLFASQILRNTCTLIQAPNVRFSFYPDYPLPYLEMTGVKIQATDIMLPSLRMIKSWGTLSEKLPASESGLNPSAKGSVPQYRLNSHEQTVLCLSEAGHSLREIAATLKLPKLEVQKIGFRLIFVGLATEVPMIRVARVQSKPSRSVPAKVSTAFLSELSDYLYRTVEPTKAAEPVKTFVPLSARPRHNADKVLAPAARASADAKVLVPVSSS